MAPDDVHDGLRLVNEGLEGLEPGGPLTDQQRWRLLKAMKGLQDADRAMRAKLAPLGVEIPPLRVSLSAEARVGVETESAAVVDSAPDIGTPP